MKDTTKCTSSTSASDDDIYAYRKVNKVLAIKCMVSSVEKSLKNLMKRILHVTGATNGFTNNVCM